MTKLVTPLFVLFLISGCSSSGPVYSWYHPLGGEYLFAFDHDKCVRDLADRGVSPGAEVGGPFFKCMQAKGYSLIQPGVDVPEYEHLGTIQ